MAKVKKQWEIPKKKMMTLLNSDRQCYMQTGEIQPFICYQLSEKLKDTNVFRQLQKRQKYEHVLPRLAAIEDDESVNGVLLLLNTMGGDVESGLAIAEMVASLSKPTVSLVLGGSHSIGVPLAVSTDYSFYCSERNHGDPSGTDEWNRDRGKNRHMITLNRCRIGLPDSWLPIVTFRRNG